jgi:hypothetical protein
MSGITTCGSIVELAVELTEPTTRRTEASRMRRDPIKSIRPSFLKAV